MFLHFLNLSIQVRVQNNIPSIGSIQLLHKNPEDTKLNFNNKSKSHLSSITFGAQG
jgi:hypothetical protein